MQLKIILKQYSLMYKTDEKVEERKKKEMNKERKLFAYRK